MWEETSNERSASNTNSFYGSSDTGSLKSANASRGSRKEAIEQDQQYFGESQIMMGKNDNGLASLRKPLLGGQEKRTKFGVLQ